MEITSAILICLFVWLFLRFRDTRSLSRMALQPFTNEQLNYFKFACIVLNEIPKALRQTFKQMWNNTLTLGKRVGLIEFPIGY